MHSKENQHREHFKICEHHIHSVNAYWTCVTCVNANFTYGFRKIAIYLIIIRSIIIRPHRDATHKMRSTAITVGWSVGHDREPCKNGWTDRNAVWVVDSCGLKAPCIRWGPVSSKERGNFGGMSRPIVKYRKRIRSVVGDYDDLIDLLAKLYGKQLAKVKAAGTLSEWFRVNKGVRQGCVLSPYLFNILVEMVMRETLDGFQGGLQIGGRIFAMLITSSCWPPRIAKVRDYSPSNLKSTLKSIEGLPHHHLYSLASKSIKCRGYPMSIIVTHSLSCEIESNAFLKSTKHI